MSEQEYALVLCDISGYTRFISQHQEVRNHGFVVVGQLLKAIIRKAGPVLQLAKIEGDAVFLYRSLPADASRRQQALLETLAACDSAFQAFVERRKELTEANLCHCEACVQAGGLDLKILLNSGNVVIHNIGRSRELGGLEVIRIHRLLKNGVGQNRYLLVTEPTAAALGETRLPEHDCAVEHHEELGECRVRVYPLPLGLAPQPSPTSFDSALYKAKDILTKILVGRLYQFGLVRSRENPS